MNAPVPAASAWPPFPPEQLPIEVQGLLDDFQWAPKSPHPPITTPLLALVVPCFNPDPRWFAQLLLSLRQQSDQAFHLLLVNDGSNDAAWAPIQAQLELYPWIQVLHQPVNAGISAALNTALEQVVTPYVALVDQDDILHPGAVALVQRYLESHPDCGLLYSDHLVFEDSGASCQYIPKFPWNPEALLEFNFLIHLTVVRVDLYRACGGMNSRFDGIQDWDFYLRLVSHLPTETVGYLPVPLYAWRLSDRSVASSASPKKELMALAEEFLAEAHVRWGDGSHVLLPQVQSGHYRFLVGRGASAAPQPCCLLLLAGTCDPAVAIQASLQSVVESGIPIARLFLAESQPAALPQPPWRSLNARLPEAEWLACSLGELADHLPTDLPLLVLRAGACLSADPAFRDLPGWLERSDHWDLITLPCLDQANGSFVSAGYSRVAAQQSVFFPHCQGLTPEAFAADFASFAHTRAVDLPSPSVQLLRHSCLATTLEAFQRIDCQEQARLSEAWWRQLAPLGWRCACPADLTVQLSPSLAAAERLHVGLRQLEGMALVRADAWLAAQAPGSEPVYGTLLQRVLEQGAGRMHPLHARAFLAPFLHPAVLQSAQRRCSRLTLLPPRAAQSLVILIPTELNARSNGHACILTLALQLQAAGHSVHLLPFKPYTFFRHYHRRLPPRFRQLAFIAEPVEAPSGLLLVPESAPRKLVKRLRPHYNTVLWWLLAPAGLLTDFRPDIRRGDRLVAFSEFTLPRQSSYLFVHPPPEPLMKQSAAEHTPQPPRQLQVALYTGKGRLMPLPRSLHRHLLTYQVVLITRSFPAKKQGLVRLLSKSNGLISFDPMTNLSLEAAILGVPTFLPANPFPARCYRRFPVDLSPFVTDSPSTFISKLQNRGPVRKLSLESLRHATHRALDIVALLASDPEPLAAEAYRVDDETLRQIEDYRQHLLRSRTILTARDGQSLSSALSHFYALSLKAPYGVHCAFCQALNWLDRIGDLLVALGLFRFLRPVLNRLGSMLVALSRRLAFFARLFVG